MKSYTDLEQSEKIAEILPHKSADMFWTNHCYGSIRSSMTVSSKTIEEYKNLLTRFADLTDIDVFYPCWSLAALLNVLPSATLDSSIDHHYRVHCMGIYTEWHDNSIDACVEMIMKLHKLKILSLSTTHKLKNCGLANKT